MFARYRGVGARRHQSADELAGARTGARPGLHAPHRPELSALHGPQAWSANRGPYPFRVPLSRDHHGAKEPVRFLRHAMFPTARSTTTITIISSILIPVPPGARICSEEASGLRGATTQSDRPARTGRLVDQSAKTALPGSGATLPDAAQTALSRDQYGYGKIHRLTTYLTSGNIALQ